VGSRTNTGIRAILLATPCLWALLASGCGDITCETIANPDLPSKIEVANNSSDTIAWSVDGYPLYAIVKEGECNVMGVQPGTFAVDLALCSDEDCSSEVSQKRVTGDLADGDTHSIDVKDGFFP
jgi:hypothetical protein